MWCYPLFVAIASKVNEWKEHKEAILRGEAPPSEYIQTEETEDIYKVEEHQVSVRFYLPWEKFPESESDVPK